MTRMPVPQRHWLTHGNNYPLPTVVNRGEHVDPGGCQIGAGEATRHAGSRARSPRP